jgi:hypothetical protein
VPASPKKRKIAPKKEFALFWCTTEDGSEDWFVVAASAKQAARYHEDSEGYDRGDADAELIAVIPVELRTRASWRDGPGGQLCPSAGPPSDALLVACGAEIVDTDLGPLGQKLGDVGKAVRFGSRLFRAGSVMETVEASFESKRARLSVFSASKRAPFPAWWEWELELTPHFEKRMEDRDFTEIDLRLMLEHASSHRPGASEGRFIIRTRSRGRPWEVVVEPDEVEHLLVVVTAYGIDG